MAIAALVGPSGAAAAGSAAPAPARIEAVYSISFAGISLGKVRFVTRVGDGSYAVEGAGRLEFLGGAIWEVSGAAASSGALTSSGPRPVAFSYQFENGKKHGKLDMSFQGDSVKEIVSDLPTPSDHSRYVPLTRDDLVGVLDPVSAFFLSAKDSGAAIDPGICDQRMPVFDGKHRFDLQLSLKKTVKVKSKTPEGYNGLAVICRVRYIPISGYKTRDDGVEFLAASDDIEVWLIPLPGAGMYMPYHVSVPTPFGPAAMTSIKVQIALDDETRTVMSR